MTQGKKKKKNTKMQQESYKDLQHIVVDPWKYLPWEIM